jgi:probable rRNA maturation factor
VSSKFVVKIANEQNRLRVSTKRLQTTVRTVLSGEGIERADVSIAIVDDPSIHEINRRYLNHDEPTDVITFALDQRDGFIDGEIVVSADTAIATAKQIGWPAEYELLLYVIHGALHLAGYDDLKPSVRRAMRAREQHFLAKLGINPPKPLKAAKKSRIAAKSR